MHKCSSSHSYQWVDPRLTDPLRRPAFRRLAASYAVNEMGDWLGIVALSVLVFDRTGSALATAGAVPRHRLPPRPARRRSSSPRVEQPPPRFVLPVIYCGEAAAFGGLALLGRRLLPRRAWSSLAAIDGALALTGAHADPGRGRGDARARRASCAPATRSSTSPSPAAPRSARRSPGWSSPPSASSRRCCSTPSPSTRSPGSSFTAGPLPHAEPEPGRLRDQVRAGLAYIREQADAAPAAGRPGRRLRLLRRGDPDRGDLREGDARRQRLRLRPAAGQLGRRHGRSAASSSPRVRRAPLPLLLFFSTIAVGAGYLGMAAAPTLAVACAASVVGGAGNGVQWVAVISAVQELTAAEHAGAGDERARVDRRGDARESATCSAA